jgi:hypothetical protein
MGFALRNGTSFCITSGRAIFLDVPGDRYFCLPDDAEQAFLHLVSGADLAPPATEIARLVQNAILVPSAGDERPAACRALSEPRTSLLDATLRSVGVGQVAAALFELRRTSRLLRRHGLAAALASATDAKPRQRQSHASREPAVSVAVAFARTALVTNAQDQCLVRSIAVARRLFRRGGRGDLVLGVRLQPFRAHCWVQDDEVVINDRPEIVREFTPILIA